MELHQKRGFQTRKIRLTNGGIKFYYKSLSEEGEHTISHEELILNRISRKKEIELTYPAITAIIFLIGTGILISTMNSTGDKSFGYFWAGLFLLVSTILFLIYRLMGISKLIFIPLSNNRRINLLQDVPDRKTVDDFLEQLTQEQSAFLKLKYGDVNSKLPIDIQLDQLQWLLNRDIITIQEFGQLRKKLTGNEYSGSIGFAVPKPFEENE